MASKGSRAVRTTLYRVHGADDLSVFVRSKYISSEDFEARTCAVGDRSALLVYGAITKEETKWAKRVSLLSGIQVPLGNSTASTVLLIQDGDDEAWALTYGMGFQLLDHAFVDAGFGIRVATRTATPEAIQSLTRNELDYRARTDRSSIPAGESLRGFGIEDFGELVTRIAGEAAIGGLSDGKSSVKVRAADALSIPLGKIPDDLVRDLDVISGVLSLEPKPELQALEQFTRVKHQELIDVLNESLESALKGDEDAGRLALGWPHERISENGTPESYRIIGLGNRNVQPTQDLPTLEVLLESILSKDVHDPLRAAELIKVLIFRDSDGDDPISNAIPAINWLTFETEIGDSRYCLFDSKWYVMDSDYGERLQRHVDEIFQRTTSIELPLWDRNVYAEESDYNSFVAGHVGGVMLDKKLLYTSSHRRGFESCDIISPSGDFIHVKHVPRSDAASHLVGQAIVSAEAILYDNEALALLRRRILEESGHTHIVGDRPTSVILVMAKEKPITASNLFTFSKVTLVRLDNMLKSRGINLAVIPIGYKPRPKSKL